MPKLVVGDKILERGLLENAAPGNLKNSTCDLTIGEIVAVGADKVLERRKGGAPQGYFIEPREMVFVLSKEEFRLPADVTGLATLRTSFTKNGLLALNVGIIDPFFSGPISTALLNFSDRAVEISVGEKFFRVLFIQHDEVSNFRPNLDESTKRESYIRDLERKAYSSFPKTYLNIPADDDQFYFRNFWRLLWHGLTYGALGYATLLIIVLLVWFLLEGTSFVAFYREKLEYIRGLLPG